LFVKNKNKCWCNKAFADNLIAESICIGGIIWLMKKCPKLMNPISAQINPFSKSVWIAPAA